MEADMISMLKNATPILNPILGDFSGIPNTINRMEKRAMVANSSKVITGMALDKNFWNFIGNRL